MTIVCLALGLAAAACFTTPARSWQIAGGSLFLLHSILDGCDGELARLKFQESRLGGILDFWADNVVHVAVFSAFAVAWSTAVDSRGRWFSARWPSRGRFCAPAFIYAYAMRPPRRRRACPDHGVPTKRSRLSELLDALARRDFIYFVLVLALFGKAYWFVAPASVGTLGFFFALLVMALKRARRDAGGRRDGTGSRRAAPPRRRGPRAADGRRLRLHRSPGEARDDAGSEPQPDAELRRLRDDLQTTAREYPAMLTAALREGRAFESTAGEGTDLWGHPVLYRRHQDGFLLIQPRPRRATRRNRLRRSSRGRRADEEPCRNPDADQVFSDRGDLRTCAK
jgi:phosphatidylglycerophosphate synthase